MCDEHDNNDERMPQLEYWLSHFARDEVANDFQIMLEYLFLAEEATTPEQQERLMRLPIFQAAATLVRVEDMHVGRALWTHIVMLATNRLRCALQFSSRSLPSQCLSPTSLSLSRGALQCSSSPCLRNASVSLSLSLGARS